MGRIPKAEKERALEELNKSEGSVLYINNHHYEMGNIINEKRNANDRHCAPDKNENELINKRPTLRSIHLVPTHFTELPINIMNNSEIAIASTIERLHELYRCQNSTISNHITQANILSSLKTKSLYGSDASLKEVWVDILKHTERNACFMIQLLQNITTLKELQNSNDIKTIINHRILDYYSVKFFFRFL